MSSVFVSSAGATTGGTNWGPAGGTGPTSSVVRVRWDNKGQSQPSYDQVARDSSQILPYTGGSTYDDASVNAAVKQAFGNLAVTVDQTSGLGHQAISLSYTGVANPDGNGPSLSVFQCWGGGQAAASGVPVSEPDPTHCETSGLGRFVATQDAPLIAKGNLPSPVGISVSGYENPNGISAHLWAQVGNNGSAFQLSPSKGSVQFETTTGRKLGKPAPVVNGVAAENVSGLTRGSTTDITATFIPAKGQNYEPSVPAEPLTVPEELFQGTGTLVESLVGQSTTSPTLYPKSLIDVSTLAATFKPGAKIKVGLNFSNGSKQVKRFGLATNILKPPGRQVAAIGTTKVAGDGSATVSFAAPDAAKLPPNPKGPGFGYVLVFTDEANPKIRTYNLAGLGPFTSPPPAPLTTPNQAPANQTAFIPFDDIEGHPQAEGESDFSADTTNEISGWAAPATASGVTAREFTVNTTIQDPNLGCGVETETPSTDTCWLVFVPADNFALNSESPLTPSLWAQRLQVRLAFAPISTSCSPRFPSVTGIGSELLGNAMASWVPAICASDKVTVNYTSQLDSVARQQYEQGDTSLIFTTRPAADRGGGISTLYAPIGLSSVTIGLHLPTATGQVTNLRLDARLVAKLLTQSYVSGIDPGAYISATFDDKHPCLVMAGHVCGINGFAPWAAKTELADLFADPEFQALNPGFSYALPSSGLNLNAGFDNLGSLVVSSTASDPIGVLWQWILSDPQAKAFLDGCPDPASKLNGRPTVVNPYFSTDSYVECRSQKAALRKAASKEIATTAAQYKAYAKAAAPVLASDIPPQSFNYTYQFTPAVYSASNPQFPLPAWYLVPPNGAGPSHITSGPSGDLHAEETSLATVEADVITGAPPWSVAWCISCKSGIGFPGAWSKEIPTYFSPEMGIADSPATSQFQTVTAQLCDDHQHCAGADTGSLLKAESRFRKTTAPGVLEPSMAPDEAGGAYPLTVPVYAGINVKDLSQRDAKACAVLLKYISTTGNQPGLTVGTLPPGYSPLPARMLTLDAAAVKTLNKLAATPSSSPSATPSSSSSPSPSSSSSPAPSSSPTPPGITTPAPSDTPVPPVDPSSSPLPTPSVSFPSPSGSPAAVPYRAVTQATSTWFSGAGLVAGLGGAIVCGGIAPLIGRPRRSRKAGDQQ